MHSPTAASPRTASRRSAVMLAGVLALVAPAPGGPAAAAAPTPRATYIVTLAETVADPARVAAELSGRHGGEVRHVYQHALKGFAVTLPEPAVARLARDTRVVAIERDQVVTTAQQSVPTGILRAFGTDPAAALDIDGVDDSRVDADIAVLDTGLDVGNPDLNIVGGVDCTGRSPVRAKCTSGGFDDGNGHGTHVAGAAAAIDNGIGVVGTAPGARLHGVKVLGDNGSGTMASIVAGIDWVTGKASVIEVANMSLGCECSSAAQDTAIRNSVAKGVVHVVAAGNSDKNADTFSPAKHPDVITVSALADFDGAAGGHATGQFCRVDVDDTLADFSNWGPAVEIAAPGVCITSTWHDGTLREISGTSMASPHVAGAAALLTEVKNPATAQDVQQVRSTLVAKGNSNWTDDSGDGVKEPLLDLRHLRS